MAIDQVALEYCVLQAYDAWLGADGNGPDRYFYLTARAKAFDAYRVPLFSSTGH